MNFMNFWLKTTKNVGHFDTLIKLPYCITF